MTAKTWVPIVPGRLPKERILWAIFNAGIEGMSRSQVRRIFHGNRPSDEIVAYLRELLADGLIRGERKETHHRGRPPEIWYITEKGRCKCRPES